MTEEATTSEVVTDGLEPNVATTTEGQQFIVGEHSVYNSVDALHKGAIEKQKYIEKLTNDFNIVKIGRAHV